MSGYPSLSDRIAIYQRDNSCSSSGAVSGRACSADHAKCMCANQAYIQGFRDLCLCSASCLVLSDGRRFNLDSMTAAEIPQVAEAMRNIEARNAGQYEGARH